MATVFVAKEYTEDVPHNLAEQRSNTGREVLRGVPGSSFGIHVADGPDQKRRQLDHGFVERCQQCPAARVGALVEQSQRGEDDRCGLLRIGA
jgi:hypothetical protein